MTEERARYTAGKAPICTTHHICQCYAERMEKLERVAVEAREFVETYPNVKSHTWHARATALERALEEVKTPYGQKV